MYSTLISIWPQEDADCPPNSGVFEINPPALEVRQSLNFHDPILPQTRLAKMLQSYFYTVRKTIFKNYLSD